MADQQEVLNRIEEAAKSFLAAKTNAKKREAAKALRIAANRWYAFEPKKEAAETA